MGHLGFVWGAPRAPVSFILEGPLKGHKNLGMWGAEPRPSGGGHNPHSHVPPGTIPDALGMALAGGIGLAELLRLSAPTALKTQRGKKALKMHGRGRVEVGGSRKKYDLRKTHYRIFAAEGEKNPGNGL